MSIEITVPEFGKSKKYAKDLVITVLTYRHPLTLTKITNTIKKEFKSQITFQGVRKAVNLLEEKGVLINKNKEYELNKDWILELKQFSEKLYETYFRNKNIIKNIESAGEDLKVYTFENLITVDQFLNQLIKEWFKKNPKGTYVQQCGHAYFALGNLEEESNINEQMKKYKIKFYTLNVNNTKLDKWVGQYFKKQGFYYKTSKGETERYFGAYEDYLFYYDAPAEITKKIDGIYNNTKDFESLDFVELVNALRKKIEIKVTVMKNPMMAEQLRSSILSKF